MAALVVAAAIPLWRWWQPAGAIVFDPQVEMSAAVLAPPSLAWLRDTLAAQDDRTGASASVTVARQKGCGMPC